MKKTSRKLPQWMKGQKHAVNNAVGNIVSAKSSQENQANGKITRFLRSSGSLSEDLSLQETSNFDKASNLPMINYTGKIHYYIDYFDIALCFETLLKQVDSMPGDSEHGNIPCAFDLEWPTDFKIGGGPMKTAVMQICMDINSCYIIQMTKLDRIPASMTEFLYHPKVLLHGVNIKNDFRKLARDFPVINSDRLIEKCVELGTYYNSVFNSSQRWSLSNLTIQTLNHQMEKGRHIRMSKWNLFPLSSAQLKYAAIDVYVGQRIYHLIREREKENSQQLEKIFNVYDGSLNSELDVSLRGRIDSLLNF